MAAPTEVKTTVRFPLPVHAALVEEVEAGHWTSLNGLIVHCCAEHVRRKQGIPLDILRAVGVPEDRIAAALAALRPAASGAEAGRGQGGAGGGGGEPEEAG